VTAVQFGMSLSRIDDAGGAARELEGLGYDYLGVGEHVFFHGPVSNGFISLAVAAGATERIGLMTTITLLPLYPAPLAAKLGAALDVSSGGRFHLGVGIGGEYAKEFEACGVPVKERGARTDEALEVIRRLWTEDDVSFEGRFNRLSGVTLAPRPQQEPHPPIWIAGRKEAAMRRTAQHGDGWLPYMYTPEMVASSIEAIAARRGDFGRDDPVTPGLFIFFAVHEDRETALEMAVTRLSKQYNQDFSGLVGRYALAGTPDDCVARLREYVDAGVRTVMLASACPSEHTDANHRLMSTEVVPRFRDG
jgi:probable F420-dependent oxidoreductase